jgi:hypothetical protein
VGFIGVRWALAVLGIIMVGTVRRLCSGTVS